MRANTAAYSARISKYLTEFSIKHQVTPSKYGDDNITIDRTSMVQALSTGDEQGAYDAVMVKLREVCGADARVMWSMRCDEWMSVEVYTRDPMDIRWSD